MSSVPRRLAKLGNLFSTRNAVYGPDYIRAGDALASLFPNGLTLRTPEEFRRFYLYVHMFGKMNRYATAISRSEGHEDTLDDLSVYSQMQQECDDLSRKKT